MKTAAIEYTNRTGAQGSEIAYRAAIALVTAASYTAKRKDHTILADATDAAQTINLPAFSHGRIIVVKKIDSSANAVTVDSPDLLDGAASVVLRNQNQAVTLQRFQHPTTKVWSWRVISESTKDAPVINTSKATDIASHATTADIGAATGNRVDVTGTTGITAFPAARAGVIRLVRFTGILTLTHNATSLDLPTGANITTAAGDRAIFVSKGSGNWECFSYQRANGTALA